MGLTRSFAGRALVANPKKLAKKIEIKKNDKFLHKDVKIRRIEMPSAPSEATLAQLCEKAIRKTAEGSSACNLQNFTNAYLEKFGANSFIKFIERHETKYPSLVGPKRFSAYLKSCSDWFKHDEKLLRMFVECDWKQVSMKAIPRAISEEEFDSRDKDELRLTSYRHQMPPAQPLFNFYTEQSSDDELESIISKPEFIQNDKDIPNALDSDDPDEIEFSIKKEKSLADFLKRQRTDSDMRTLDFIPMLNEVADFDPTPSPFVYIKLEYGDDSLLTKSAVLKILEIAKIKDVKSVNIFSRLDDVTRADPGLECSLLDAELKGRQDCLDEEKLVELSEAARESALPLPSKEALQDEQLTGLSTQSSEMERDTQRIKEIFKFAANAPRPHNTNGFIEFHNVESKAQLLKPTYRLFGMEINGGLMVTEDADIKRTLRIGNLPWDLSLVRFTSFLNNLISKSDCITQFSCPEEYHNCVSDASFLYVHFSSFMAAYKMVRLLNTGTYKGRQLQVTFKQGCGKYLRGRFVENYHSALSLESEEKHIILRNLAKKKAAEEVLVNN